MADITKRVQKKLQNFLDEGEVVEAAILVEPKGTYGVGMVGHAMANNVTTKILQNSAKKSQDETGGVASTVPSKPFVIIKTAKKILIVESNGIRFAEPTLQLELNSIKVVERKRKLFGQRLTLQFKDGSGVTVDAQLGQPVEAFM